MFFLHSGGKDKTNHGIRVKLPKSFTAVNLSEKGVFTDRAMEDAKGMSE